MAPSVALRSGLAKEEEALSALRRGRRCELLLPLGSRRHEVLAKRWDEVWPVETKRVGPDGENGKLKLNGLER